MVTVEHELHLHCYTRARAMLCRLFLSLHSRFLSLTAGVV